MSYRHRLEELLKCIDSQSNELPYLLPPPPHIPRTLQPFSPRYSILPAFPSSMYNNQPPLLFVNVPANRLSREQLLYRQQNIGSLGYTTNNDNHDIPSYFRHIYQSFIGSLITKYNLNESIIEYNLYRFSQCFDLFVNELIQYYSSNVEKYTLSDTQKKYAFEFYLQIDADQFYMKTCSYRGAQIHPNEMESIFSNNAPIVRYGLYPCHQCSLCIPQYNVQLRGQSTIRFGPNQIYQFLNGYRTILNCPANCRTDNLIYVMTCPCGQYEYIGETRYKLSYRLQYHREHFNRIIHEFLLGIENMKLSQTKPKDRQTLNKDAMLLYRHAARCPSVIQRFLNFNPNYWHLIPITTDEVIQYQNYNPPYTLTLFDRMNPTAIGTKNRQFVGETQDTRSDEQVRTCIRNLPPLPSGYTFSIPQRIAQFQYFKAKCDIKEKMKQNQIIDLFEAAIIAVLPVDATEIVRKFVESLFITHIEPNLNTSGRLLYSNNNNNNNNNNDNNDDRGQWCRNLIVPHNL